MEENYRILIVEDEKLIAISIEDLLIEHGYEVLEIADSGERALTIVKEKKPTLVLMDIKLKGELSGVEAADILHRDYNIPVIYLTSYADEKTVEKAKYTEAYGYILKPFNPDELLSSIQIAIYKHRAELIRNFEEQLISPSIESFPVALVEMNWSLLNEFIEKIIRSGVKDLSSFFRHNPQSYEYCVSVIVVNRVNKLALSIFNTDNKKDFTPIFSKEVFQQNPNLFLECINGLVDENLEIRNIITVPSSGSKDDSYILNLTDASLHKRSWVKIILTLVKLP